jgi:multidrug efflux system membrane fusion protein
MPAQYSLGVVDSKPVTWLACILLAFFAGAGCGQKAPGVPRASMPVVNVSQPVQREVTDFVDFTGRTDSIFSVDIRPRVTGYLVRMPFKEGEEVTIGELLFEIDPRPYQAQLDQAESQVALNQAQLKLAIANFARGQNIAKTPGAISQQDLDTFRATQEQALASVAAAQANVETYKLNLSFTHVTSPIDGMVSRYYLTLGNLVNQDQTLLTTVVSLDPMYAYFDMDEPTLLSIRRRVNEGKIKRVKDRSEIPVMMGLQGEAGFPHVGSLNFVNNRVDTSTGTITVRSVFQNPKPPNGVRLLSPGMFVRIRLPIGKPHPALLVADQCVGTDQGLKFLYVVDSQNKVQYRTVELGPLQEDGMRVIDNGIKPDDWVVVTGLQQIQPHMAVESQRTPMIVPFSTTLPDQPAAKTTPPPAGQAPSMPAPGPSQPGSPPAKP